MEVSAPSSDRKRSVAIRRAILRWYGTNGRRFPWRKPSATLYEKIVAEVLLQRTQAATVNLFFRAFLNRFPGWNALAAATPDEIAEFLKPIGLWRRRANSLSQLAAVMAKRRGKFPTTRDEIEALPGVGQYIASAVLIFSQAKPEPLLDGSMARVIERIFGPRQLVDIRYDPHLQAMARLLVAGPAPDKINWAILDLAAIVCTTTPSCHLCPARRWCSYANSMRQTA
jgi:A/G-specific adenine glycosylase